MKVQPTDDVKMVNVSDVEDVIQMAYVSNEIVEATRVGEKNGDPILDISIILCLDLSRIQI